MSKKNSDFVKQSLLDAGFLINVEKSVFEPTKDIEWLGIQWHSSSLFLSIPDKRIFDLLQSIDVLLEIFPKFTARQLAQVTGKIISLSPVFGNLTRLMTRFCYMCIESRFSWDSVLNLLYPEKVVTEIKFWKNNVVNLNNRKLAPYKPQQILVFSDASDLACGAYSVEVDDKVFHKMWNDCERVKSSTWRELRAIEQALISFGNAFTGSSLKWFTDNQNCVRIIQAGSMKDDLQELAFSIFSICRKFKIFSLEVQWIPRTENAKADYISRMIDHEDWQTTIDFFSFLDNLWGPFSVDRFASMLNRKTVRFNSLFWHPSSEAVDAFTQIWSNDNNWLVPPIYLVVRTIKHLVAQRARGTLIVPRWVSAAYWPFIFDSDMMYRDYVKDVLEFTEHDRIYVKGSSPKCIFGTEKFISTVLAVKLDAK